MIDICECGHVVCEVCWQCVGEHGHLPDCPWAIDDDLPHNTTEEANDD